MKPHLLPTGIYVVNFKSNQCEVLFHDGSATLSQSMVHFRSTRSPGERIIYWHTIKSLDLIFSIETDDMIYTPIKTFK